MSEKKPPTLIIKVDLGNETSYKKIQKILCDLQIPEKIKTIAFDDKKNTVTITGPFDPAKLTHKIHCKACKVCLHVEVGPPPPPPPTPTPPPPPPCMCQVTNNIKIRVGSKELTCEEPCKKHDSCRRPDCPVCCCTTYCVTYPECSRCCSCGKGHGCCKGHGS